MILISANISNINWQRYQSIWMILILVLWLNFFHGQMNCLISAGKRRKNESDKYRRHTLPALSFRWLTFKWAFFVSSRYVLFAVYGGCLSPQDTHHRISMATKDDKYIILNGYLYACVLLILMQFIIMHLLVSFIVIIRCAVVYQIYGKAFLCG